MTRRHANPKSPEREALLEELGRIAERVPTEVLVPLLSFAATLTVGSRCPLTGNVVRRAVARMNMLRHFAALRHDPSNRERSNRQLIAEAMKAAPSIAPGLRCSCRSMLRWIAEYNEITPDGLAAGFPALIDRYGRPRKRARTL